MAAPRILPLAAALALMFAAAAPIGAAPRDRPFGGPPPPPMAHGKLSGKLWSRRCVTPEFDCRLKVPRPIGTKCSCSKDGYKVRGRVRLPAPAPK
jgi:hypothetical protein